MKRSGSWLLLGAGALALGACSTMTPPPSRASTAPTAPDAMIWNYDANYNGEGREAKLAYGVPDTDAVGVMFFCGRKSPALRFVTDLDDGAPGPGVVRFQSGKSKGRYPARLETSEASDGLIASGRIALTDAVLTAFEKTGLISQVEKKTYPQDAHTAAERADIRRFFSFCRG